MWRGARRPLGSTAGTMTGASRSFHLKTCRNCKGKDPCVCSLGRNHEFTCCNYGRITLGPMDGYEPPSESNS